MVDGGLAVDDGFGSAGSFDDVDGRVRNLSLIHISEPTRPY